MAQRWPLYLRRHVRTRNNCRDKAPEYTPRHVHTPSQPRERTPRGDQFCVYVADRLVLPTLSQEEITAIASGRHQMDAFVRRYIHENLCYRFVMLPDGAAAYAVETAIKSGGWGHGCPLLNPGSRQ